MRIKKIRLYVLLIFLITPWLAYANHFQGIRKAPQPTPCIKGTFSKTGNQFWSIVSLKLQNTCTDKVDFQNSTITFKNGTALNTSFWGDFGPLTYPDNNLQITSQSDPSGGYLATMKLHFPDGSWVVSKLPAGAAITLKYGVETASYVADSAKVYLSNDVPVQTGQITLINQTQKPANVTQNYAVVDVKSNGVNVTSVQLAWNGQAQVPGLAPGNYTIAPLTVNDTQGNSYQGNANPASITLAANQTVTSNINYALVTGTTGKINLQVAPLPAVLSGYPNQPSVTLTQTDTGTTVNKTATWSATTLISQLNNNKVYRFSAPEILFNSNRCTATFTPVEATSNAQTPPTVNLVYNCVPVNQVTVTLNVNGLSSATTAVDVMFTPTSGTSIVKTVNLANGSGNTTLQLAQGSVYNVSSTTVAGFTASFNPQPFTASANGTETVTYQAIPPVTGGRIIGYVPGWKQPPSAQSLKTAGYTHMMIAFGVFSTSEPGKLVPALDTITKAYIDQLHNAGIKAVLSVGGALTGLPNTSVDFHQVLTMAASPQAFQQTFVQSVKDLATQYGFDGIDFDIEHGLTLTGTFQNPTGDVAALANIINQIRADLPNFLITMAPETQYISATANFGNWGTYASLIMKTHAAITWVGIQLYNTGCMLGIDTVCYSPLPVTSPDFSVAMATDLLENWPSTANGQPTGFQPYISMLRPDQVVLGYLSANAQGTGDGSPVIPTGTIKRAIQCLKTKTPGANSCGNYVPPKAYGLVGGVFNWEITFDQSNQFKFATDLKTCVSGGAC